VTERIVLVKRVDFTRVGRIVVSRSPVIVGPHGRLPAVAFMRVTQAQRKEPGTDVGIGRFAELKTTFGLPHQTTAFAFESRAQQIPIGVASIGIGVHKRAAFVRQTQEVSIDICA
jgi:hypothetical protein